MPLRQASALLRALVPGIAAVGLATACGPAFAICKTTLPTPDLRALDESADDDPVGAIAAARAALERLGARDDFRRAQLHAIVADAYDTTSDDAEARRAVAGGLEALARVPQSADADAIRLRLELVGADTAETRTEVDTAVRTLDGLESAMPRESLAHACLLIVRARVRVRVGEYETAVRDGLQAYRLSADLGAAEAHAEAAFQLAATYRRAGLHDAAVAMVAEAVARARERRSKAWLSTVLWQQAQILEAAGRAEEALPVADESRALSVEIGDSIGVTYTDHVRCSALLRLGRVNEADSACLAADTGFRAVHRDDQIAVTLAARARVDLARGHAAAALAKLDVALADGGRRAQPDVLPRLYEIRADALAQLGRHAEALDAMRRSRDLNAAVDARQRGLAVAILKVQSDAERSEFARLALERQLLDEREHAANRELVQRLTIGLAVGIAALAALLAYLLVSARRYARTLRQQEAILRQISENAPDALVLLDRTGATRFANRAPFDGAAPAPGRPFADAVPDAARAVVAGAVAQLVERREAVVADVRIAAGAGERHYELRGQPIVDEQRLIGATLRISDVTDRRTLERQVLDAAARERRQLGADLHEGLGQELAGIALQLGAAANAARRGRPDAADIVGEAVAHLDLAVAATRDLARGISPVELARGSLSLALGRLAADATRRLGIEVAVKSIPAEIVVPADASDHLYRIALEAVGNAAAHSRCRSIQIVLSEDAEQYALAIEDDGLGLPRDADRGAGMGLRIMTYRARLLGGSFRLEPAPGGGTRVAVVVPRSPADA